jgi:hypothetical protein
MSQLHWDIEDVYSVYMSRFGRYIFLRKSQFFHHVDTIFPTYYPALTDALSKISNLSNP